MIVSFRLEAFIGAVAAARTRPSRTWTISHLLLPRYLNNDIGIAEIPFLTNIGLS